MLESEKMWMGVYENTDGTEWVALRNAGANKDDVQWATCVTNGAPPKRMALCKIVEVTEDETKTT